jgi:hypothetical protein
MEGKKWKVILAGVFTLALVVAAGLSVLNFTLGYLESSEKESLLLRAGTIALTLDPNNIQSLRGDRSDLTNESYQALKRNLIEIRALNQDVRFVYILGLKGNKQFFYVDSEDPSSDDYSYPGQPYDDALPEDIQNHKSGTSYTMGPYSDSWGEWVSAYAPVMTDDGKVAGMVGLDIAAEDYQLQMNGIKAIAYIIMGLISVSVILIMIFAVRGEKKVI